MFEYIFPIFCFGVVITAIVAKGMMTAAEVARNHPDYDERDRSLPAAALFTADVKDVGRANDRSQFQPLS